MVIFGKLVSAAVSISLCIFLLRSRFVLCKPSSWQFAALLVGSWALLGCVNVLWSYILIQPVLAVAIAGFLCWYVGQASPAKAMLFGLVFGGLQITASGAALFIINLFSGVGTECTVLLEITALYVLVICASVFSKQWLAVSVPLLQLIPVWLVAVILCEEVIRNQGYEGVVVLEIFGFVWLLYAGILLIQVGDKMDARVQNLLEKQQKAHHYALQEEYYQQLRSKQIETRALWHDLNKYLRAARAEAPTAQALEQLESMLNSATEIVDVDNQVLNVILNEYAQMAKAAGIDLRLKIHVPPKLNISVADLYILIGNTMDNAIEACNALPPDQRIIDLILRIHNDVLYYKLTNPYASEQTTRKADPMHGHGLQNVRRCVENYDGFIDIVKENGVFTVTAHLNIDPV